MMDSHDVKLDTLDMEMSDDENDSLVKGLPIPTINSSSTTKSYFPPPTVRTHLDPRQNRMNSCYSPSNLNKIKNEECSTPIKDEIDQNATKNSLDFLTRFISKTSTTVNTVNNHQNINSNNNNIISSLQKYVCNTAPSATFIKKNNLSASNYETNAYDPREYNYEGYYTEDLYNDEDLINDNHGKDKNMKRQRSMYDTPKNIVINQSISTQNQRSVTPTKDEIYQSAEAKHQKQYSHYQPTSIAAPPPPPPPPPIPHHPLIGHNYTMPPQAGFPHQSLIPPPQPPPNLFNNQLMQQPLNQYMPNPPPPPPPPNQSQPYPMPQLLHNYQKPLNNSNKPSNNININTNDLNRKNEDSMKRKHDRSSYEYPNMQQNNNSYVKNQNSYRIPTISSSHHRNDSNGNNNNNNKSNFNPKYNQPPPHRSNSYYNNNNKHHKY